jgi:signal transduction histidine kinase
VVDQTDTALVLIRIAWSITPLLFILIYSFIINFLEKAHNYKIFTFASYLIGVIFLFVTLLTKLIIKNTVFENETLNIIYGNFVWLFFGVVAFYTVVSFYLLIKYFRDSKTSKATKSKIKFLLGGLSILFIANSIFNIVFPVFFNIFHLYEFGDYTTVIFISLIAYAIVRHNLFDIRIIVPNFIVSFLGTFLAIDAVIFSTTWEQRILKIFVLIIYIPFGYLLIRSVIREVRQREKLQQLTARLKELDKQKDEFISVAAHELRSPLTAIKGYISMVVEGDGGKVEDKARAYLSDANAVNDRLIRLVNNMLNVSRIEEGRLVYQMEVVDLIKAAQEIYYSFKFEAERKKLKFDLDVSHGVNDKVEVDPDRVREIIGNYVSNAIKFTDEGSVKIRITNPTSKSVKVEVIDTGPGISKEEQKKLFKKFSRASSTEGKTIGTGLGLYISKLLTEKFDGKVGLESEFKKGSNFWFELPLVQK